MRKRLIQLLVILVFVVAVWGGWYALSGEEPLELRTASVTRGPLTLAITATGRLAPTTQVSVGCEVSGTVQEVLVKYNDRVSRGQVMARLRPELYRAQHEQAKAALARANAQLRQLEVQEREAKRELDRVEGLRREGAATEQEHAGQLAAHEAATANTAAGRAAVQDAQSRVQLTEYRLERTAITSPIDGIVLDQRVDVGQTVAAEFLAPELFVVAEDLSRMELLADVAEADVGYLCPGQPAAFTVNAYRDRSFEGRVRQIRNQPNNTGNVVTYTVVISVTNRDRLLRPGMPADVTIEIIRRGETTKVANAALRFRPPLLPDEIRRFLDGLTWPAAPEPIEVGAEPSPDAGPGGSDFPPPPIEPAKATFWQHVDGAWKPVPVWTRFTDNRETAIAGGPEVAEGSAFVIEIRKQAQSRSTFQRAILLTRPENRSEQALQASK